MAFKSNATIYNAPMENVWQALEETCSSLKWSITARKPEQGLLEVKSRASVLCPLGVCLNIRLTAVDQYKTQIHTEAKSRGQMVDYGQSSREIKRLLETFSKIVVSVNELKVHNSGEITCAKCGCTLESGVKFCRKCGEPVTTPTLLNEPEVSESKYSCRKCGKELNSSMKFCPQCGEPTV
jgi:RNA polymerase subunit RPABC4/transcription elongation factor Spt4